MRRLLALVTALGATAGMAQQPPPAEGARELFFAGAAPKDELPPVRQSAPAKAAPATVPPASQPGRATSGSAAALGAVHLGLRYNLLLVSARGDRGQPVDPDRNFRKGDCVAVELEANRSGYLYVLSKQSSGDWVPLFPTPELSDQSNRIDPGRIVRRRSTLALKLTTRPGQRPCSWCCRGTPATLTNCPKASRVRGIGRNHRQARPRLPPPDESIPPWDGLPSSMARATCRSGRLPSRLRRRRHLRDRRSRMSRSMRCTW